MIQSSVVRGALAALAAAACTFAGPRLQAGGAVAFAAPSQQDLALAKTHYQAAVAYYDQGQFQDAVREFHESYKLSDKPEILYNIAVCYDHLRQDDAAESYYKKYLEALPNAPDRETVRALINAIDARRPAASGTATPGTSTANGPPASFPAPAASGAPAITPAAVRPLPPSEGGASLPSWFERYRGAVIAGGATVVVLGVGTVCGLVAQNANDQLHTLDTNRSTAQANQLVSTANNFGLAADVLLGASAAGVVATGVLYYLEGRQPDHGSVLAGAVTPAPGGAAFVLTGRF